MPRGHVTYFDEEKGFGFIETGATKDDVFFHVQMMSNSTVEEGSEIKFDIEPPEDKDDNPSAINPEVIN